LVIMGKTTDTYLHQEVKVVKYKGREVDKTPRGTKNEEIQIELKVDGPVFGKGQDKVYVFTDRTYENRTYSL